MRALAMILAGCAALTLDWSPASAAPPAQAAAPAEVRLPHISVVKLGAGSPVVLIPGLSTPRDVWSAVAPELAAKHTVYLVQVNGFAGDPAGSNSAEGMIAGIVEDLHGMLVRDGTGPADLVGHSMGGLMAMMLASAHPGDVAKVMIVDSLPFAGAMFDENATVEALRPMVPMLKGRLESGYVGAEGEAAAEATAKSLTAKPESAATVLGWIKRADPKVAAEAMAEAVTTDLRPRLPSIQAPLTIVHPAAVLGKDAAATDAFYRRQYASAAKAEFVVVPDSGHFVMLDQPQRFAEALRAFLK